MLWLCAHFTCFHYEKVSSIKFRHSRDSITMRSDSSEQASEYNRWVIRHLCMWISALLSYRSYGCCRHVYRKLFHTIFNILAVPAIVMGFLTVLDSHNLAIPPIPNFYSLHSWMGLTTMGLFALQVARVVI